MQHDYAKDFWIRLLTALAGSKRGTASFVNPAYESNPTYSALDISEEAVFYGRRPVSSADQILLKALRSTSLEQDEVAGIADILASASSRISYTDIHEEAPKPVSKKKASLSTATPQEIYSNLSDVYGQETAKKSLSTFVYNFLHGHPGTLLLAGPSGSGKTELIRSLQQHFKDIDIRVLDGGRLAADGYKGSAHLRDAFTGDPEKDKRFILVIDEFDKTCQPQFGSNGTNYTEIILNQLLKLLDRDFLTFSENSSEKFFYVDPKGIGFILMGAFENLFQQKNAKSAAIGFGAAPKTVHDYSNTMLTADDLIAYGVRREICGRITDIALLHPLTEQDFRALLDRPSSPISRVEKEYGLTLKVSDAMKDLLAKKAYESGLGCRAVYSEIRRLLDDAIFKDCTKKSYDLDHIEDENTKPVNDDANADPEFVL